jgi:hypothetical protein
MTILEEGATRAREVLAKVRPGPLDATRSLPIRAEVSDIEQAWARDRARLLEDIPVAEAAVEYGALLEDWGRVTTVTLRLETAVPGVAANALAGKVVRRLKALAETGEVPVT